MTATFKVASHPESSQKYARSVKTSKDLQTATAETEKGLNTNWEFMCHGDFLRLLA